MSVKSEANPVKLELAETTRGVRNSALPLDVVTDDGDVSTLKYVKPELDAGEGSNAAALLSGQRTPISRTSSKITQPQYNVFKSVDEIDYLPENALKEGLGIVKTLKSNIKTLELGNKMRKDVWLREIERCGDLYTRPVLYSL